MRRPRVLVTPWRRELPTFFGPKTDLLTINPSYPDAVRRAGGLPIVSAHLDEDELADLFDDVDAVVVTGGQDMDPAIYGADNTSSWKVRPDSDEFDLAVVRGAIDRSLPMLAVCRGIQVLNVALGGDLRQEVQSAGDPDHPLYKEMPDAVAHRHTVEVIVDSRLAAIYAPGPLSVNSLHHQAIGRVADGLYVVATSADGTVEAVEGERLDAVAVQWHPELIPDEGGDALFADLVRRANARMALVQ